ncbi:RNA 2',3'-cyclic phosphodiesterase [Candidatus Pacearchaeota archaeon]|nr:RNA 2',3'-cyclic phosphodiesterase [Candidatus Pacearchaeota archaeon]
MKKRIFIAIDFPSEILKEIAKIQEKLPEFIGKKTEIFNLHLTLKFLGEVEAEQIEKIKRKLHEIKIKKFKAEIGELGVFSSKFIRILWLSLRGCEKLQKEIDEKLADLFEKEKRFMGHLTIARIKKIEDKKKFLNLFKNIKISPIEFEIKEFKLKSSILEFKNPKYKDIGIYPLEN